LNFSLRFVDIAREPGAMQTVLQLTSRRTLARVSSGLLLSGTPSSLSRNLLEEDFHGDDMGRLGQVATRSASTSSLARTDPCRSSPQPWGWLASKGFKSGHPPSSGEGEERGEGPPPTPANESKTDRFNLIQPGGRLVQIHACLPGGFLIGDRRVQGSVIAVGDLWLRWKPRIFSEITIESLVLVDIVKPVPDILVIGCGEGMRQVDPGLMRCLEDRFLGVEALDTKNAVSTFNILNAEGRSVVGAFLAPPGS